MLEQIIKNNIPIKTFKYETGKLTEIIENDIIKLEYDNYGNTTKIGNIKITYNERNKMESYQQNNNKYYFEYNYQGIRTKKIKENDYEINYYLDGTTIIGEDVIDLTNNQTIRQFRYIYNENEISGINYIKDNENHYFNLIKDTLGNIAKVMYRGKIIGEYIYDAWGNSETKIYEDTNPNNIDRIVLECNPFRYKGYYYDVETQLFYCNSRYYSPELCRWISPDLIEYLDPENINGLNLYCYCYNNPIMYVDDMGNLPVPVDVITSIIGYSADLYSFGLKLSLKSMPELSMAVAKKMARKAGHIQSARSYIRARHSNIVKTQNLSKGAKNFSKHFGRAVLVADILWSVGENYASGDPNWVSDSVVDVGMSVGIYALGCIPYVGWALAIGATILTEVFDDEIEEFKDWFADGWNDFWSFSWAS